MSLQWLVLRNSSLPAGDEWLGPEEKRALSRFTLPKRRAEWRLGRFTAKQALASSLGIDRFDRIELIAAADGAPEVFVDGKPAGLSVSISHRKGAAACVWSPDLIVGCDVEAIEPRTQRFVEDFFTDRERASVLATTGFIRQRHVALVWSAKESALKVIRSGLRRDTRQVEVAVEDPAATGEGWHPLRTMLYPESRRLPGWWRQEGELVLTAVTGAPG